MNTITVSASTQYSVHIGSGLMGTLHNYTHLFSKAERAVIVSDSNVWPLYGEKLQEELQQAGLETGSFVFPAGEESKNSSTYLSILNYLAANNITRTDLLVALGGGVVGDITGFAAATYLRGIPYIQIPTTLLAMVDSSVGGKTAIDLPGGKNLVGAFYQPIMVLCDIDTLDTLPASIFRDGCAEVIKYGVLYDPKLFEHLEKSGLNFDRKSTITRCVELKRNVVTEDEFDTGTRQKLNLGHTIGHGIEASSNFSVSHGQAVATGMAIVSKAGSALGICSDAAQGRIVRILETFGLPVKTNCPPESLLKHALSDKKRTGGTVNLIIPQDIGSCIIKPTPISALKSFIEEGM